MGVRIFVPGRLCLFGEHTDWAGKYRTMNADIVAGQAIVTGIEQGIEAEVEKSSIFEMYSEAPEIKDIWQDFACRMNEKELKTVAKSGSFFSYCAGVASCMLEWNKVGGVKITLKHMTLPMKSGLSSSAAICVLVARAFNIIYNLNLNTLGEMNIAYTGEIRTSSRCGRLDQACAFGVKPHLMIFDGDEIEVNNINVKKHLFWVFADLCSKKDTIKILQDLNKAYPFPSNEQEIREHEALGVRNQEIIKKAIHYMGEGDAESLGKLMTEAQRLFDEAIAPMSPDELKSPVLHKTLSDPNIQPLVYGGKGVGSQGDGSIQFLAKDEECQTRLVEYLKQIGMKPYKLTLKPVHTVRKAVIPVAGFGTRLYPTTRTLKKDFFPIPDKDGMIKPVILILLEELVNSGIEEICLVLGSEEERLLYRDFFEKELSEEVLSKLNSEMQEYEKKIIDIGKKIKYVYQRERKGFGHAVYQAADFANGEPVLLLLGDTLYRSVSNKSCSQQLIEIYEKYNKPMVAIHDIPLETVSHYGVMTGVWEDRNETEMNITSLCEKPKASYAEEFLAMKMHNGSKRYYSVFGMYILTQDVFAQLEEDIRCENISERGEIELTSALEKVREKVGLIGIQLQGHMYDMGNYDAYRNAFLNFNTEQDPIQ